MTRPGVEPRSPGSLANTLPTSLISVRNLCGVMAKVLDCGPKVSEFKCQSHYYVHFQMNTFGKGIETPYSLSFGLNSITAILLQGWIWH